MHMLTSDEQIQKEVIPVDTHVLQIAVKHYGLRALNGTSMSPKLYDDVNAKLVGIWGDYAGWAHSVCLCK
jgi:N-glycosylase/DNA lyase